MGIKIITDDRGVRVWRSDKYGFAQYSVSIQTKKENGGYITEYKQVKFRGGIELENGDTIIIKDAFPTLDTWHDKTTNELKTKEVWVIMDFVYKTDAPQTERRAADLQSKAEEALGFRKQAPATQMQMTSQMSDLPFAAAEDDIPF